MPDGREGVGEGADAVAALGIVDHRVDGAAGVAFRVPGRRLDLEDLRQRQMLPDVAEVREVAVRGRVLSSGVGEDLRAPRVQPAYAVAGSDSVDNSFPRFF